jgi:hypothetical protein
MENCKAENAEYQFWFLFVKDWMLNIDMAKPTIPFYKISIGQKYKILPLPIREKGISFTTHLSVLITFPSDMVQASSAAIYRPDQSWNCLYWKFKGKRPRFFPSKVLPFSIFSSKDKDLFLLGSDVFCKFRIKAEDLYLLGSPVHKQRHILNPPQKK